MANPEIQRNPVEQLAEEFLARYRQGERPALTEYTNRYPDLAAEIRELFPALVMMEEVGPGESAPPGPLGGATADGRALERLGEYRILREVGRGGMGIVYEAEQTALGRHVALKVLPFQAAANPVHRQRFRREARSAARLHHTNIVPVFDVGECRGVHYYAMQFIQGQGLDEVLHELRRLRSRPEAHDGLTVPAAEAPAPRERDQSLSLATCLVRGRFVSAGQGEAEVSSSAGAVAVQEPPSEHPPTDSIPADAPPSAVVRPDPRSSPSELSTQTHAQYYRSVARVGLQVAEALAYAHGQKVLHRDIKPANLLLDLQGIIWVTDFGLAKGEGDDLTQTGDLLGTLRYMAPERFNGVSDARSDVYSLGLTLYELLTLRPAFDEPDRGRLIKRIAQEEPPRPRRRDPALPRDLETIVLKACAKEPAHRYASAEELADDLRRFLADRPIRARRASAGEQAWRWCRRNPLLALATGSAAVLLVVVAVISAVSAIWLKGQRDEAAEARRQAEAARQDARLGEAEALVGQAHGTRLSRRPGQRFEALRALGRAAAIGRELDRPPEWFARLRNEAIAALALPDVHITQEGPGIPPGTAYVELSDDFEWYVRTTKQGGCTIYRVADDTVVVRLPDLDEPAWAVFGRGPILARFGVSSRRLQLWALDGDRPVCRLKEQDVQGWSFRRDGRHLGLSHQDGSIAVYDVATGKRLHTLARLDLWGPGVELHPDAPFVAATAYDRGRRTVQVRDLRTGALVASAVPPWPGSNGPPAWSPDGRTLIVSEGNGGKLQQYAFDPARPALRPTRTLEAPPQGFPFVAFNAAGDRFVSRGWSGTVHLFDTLSGQLLFVTHGLPTASTEPLHFDLSGQRLAGARVGERNDRLGVWSIADAREYRACVFTRDGLNDAPEHSGPAIHPDGRLAAVSRTDGVALFDLETGRELAHLPAPVGKVHNITFDATGNLITNGFEGCSRWPIRPDPANPNRLQVGRPERLPFGAGNNPVAASEDGRVIAQAMYSGYGMEPYAGGWILHPSSPAPRRVEARQSVAWTSVSPDGQWVAFGTHMDRVNVYDARTGRRVWQSPAEQHSFCRFSPDGRWLVTDVDGGRLYAVGTWEPGPQLGPGMPWDVTRDLAALGQTNGIYRLVELATGRELARLEDPEQNTGMAGFTPDGSKLVVAARNGLRVWDLRRVRRELNRLGLDWQAPAYPDAGGHPPPLQVTVLLSLADRTILLYNLALALQPANPQALLGRGRAYFEAKDWDHAADDLDRALALDPANPDAQVWFELGYSCACSSGPRKGSARYARAARGIAAYTRAIELNPKLAIAWNNRGAYYQDAGELQKALADYAQAAKLDSTNAMYQDNLARLRSKVR